MDTSAFPLVGGVHPARDLDAYMMTITTLLVLSGPPAILRWSPNRPENAL